MNISIDIIIFAVIAGVLLFRLRSVLGERNENEPKGLDLPSMMRSNASPKEDAPDAPALGLADMAAGTHVAASSDRWAQELPNYALVANATAHNHLAQFLALDPSFRPDDFLGKAQKAFMMIIEAFSTGQRDTLEFLVAPPLLQRFMNRLDQREQQKETYHVHFYGTQNALISAAELNGTIARVTVDFTSEQGVTHKDSEDRIIDMHDGQKEVTQDRWVFQKDLKDPTPAWLLVATEEID